MTHNPTFHKLRGATVTIVAATLLLVIYVLGEGPVAWLTVRGGVPVTAYHFIYAPLNWLGSACPPVGSARTSYLLRWVDPLEMRFYL